MNFRSIRFRLISWYAGLLTVLFVFLGISGYLGLQYYLKQLLKIGLTKRANLIAGRVSAHIDLYGDKFVVEDIEKYYTPAVNNYYFRIIRSDGTVLYHSGEPKDASFNPIGLPIPRQPVVEPFLHEVFDQNNRGLFIYTMPMQVPSGKEFLIEAGISQNQIKEPLDGLLFLLAVCFPIMVTAAIAGGYLLIGRALIPVDEITQHAERLTSRNLEERLPIVRTGDELERLSVSLNNMIERLDKAFQHISRFSADASHELRTPLTILHCDLEAIIQRPRLDNEVRETIGSALGETERLARIVDGLLSISRLDTGEARIEILPFDLAVLTSAIVEQMRLLADDKEIRLNCQAGAKVIIEGDSQRLKQVVVNLLDNAIKYTPEGGSIDVSVIANGSVGVLEVKDTGIGIVPEALPHVFERFYRTDRARSRQQGGAGLGLSIVKSICTAHGGKITVDSKEGEGSCFRIELPLYKPDEGPIDAVVTEKEYA